MRHRNSSLEDSLRTVLISWIGGWATGERREDWVRSSLLICRIIEHSQLGGRGLSARGRGRNFSMGSASKVGVPATYLTMRRYSRPSLAGP